jgi:hypothetical protein
MAHVLEKEFSMSQDPFILDMFGSNALSSGFGLGLTAFGGFAANDDDPDPPPPSPTPALPLPAAKRPATRRQGERTNFYLNDGDDRGLAATWKERAKANLAAILTATEIEKQDRPATRDEQAKLIRFTGFGASELANGMFRRPGEVDFPEGWDDLGGSLESAVTETDYASLTLHAGIHRPRDLGGTSASRLAWRPGAGAGDRHGPVSGADANSSQGYQPCYRNRTRSGDGTDCPAASAEGARHQCRLRAHRSQRDL